MTNKEFDTKKWGAGDKFKYEEEGLLIITDVLSVDFSERTIGMALPNGAIIRNGEGLECKVDFDKVMYLPCTKCTIVNL